MKFQRSACHDTALLVIAVCLSKISDLAGSALCVYRTSISDRIRHLQVTGCQKVCTSMTGVYLRKLSSYYSKCEMRVPCSSKTCYIAVIHTVAVSAVDIHLRFRHAVPGHTSAIWVLCLGQYVCPILEKENVIKFIFIFIDENLPDLSGIPDF